VEAITTSIFPRGGNLAEFIFQSIPSARLEERMIIAVTSKIVSLSENRLISQSEISKDNLVRLEADIWLGEGGYGCALTIKDGLLIPSAGIDESNSAGGDFILYPEDSFRSAKSFWQELREFWGLNELRVILTDSHSFPLRWGVTGVCLSYWGFRAIKNMIGSQDLFGRELRMTKINRADAFSAAAVLTMGEGGECRPLALLSGMECEFCEETDPSELKISLENDLYYPLLKTIK
jgi:F420-0:gamma-glutamyl ligase